jgi:hypothetical protein
MCASWHDFSVPPVPPAGGPSEARGGCAGQPPTVPPNGGEQEPRVSQADIERAIRNLDVAEKRLKRAAALLGAYRWDDSPNVHDIAHDVFARIPGEPEVHANAEGFVAIWKRRGPFLFFRTHKEA